MRVALATALFANPDLLLLDEPTNHLDLEATMWLEGWLARFPGAALVVSHDRGLLDRAVEAIAHLDRGKISLTPGGFDEFVRIRTERALQQARAAERVAAERAHIQSFIDRFRYKASKARQAQARIKALERLPQIEIGDRGRADPLRLPGTARASRRRSWRWSGSTSATARSPVLRNVSLTVDMDDRIALLGANGNGKSTLAKLLADRLRSAGRRSPARPEAAGRLFRPASDRRTGRCTKTRSTTWRARCRTRHRAKLRAQLARFGLDADRAETPVANLSGGEKARLLLALATRDAPQLLILDEPTNHLDIDAREALVKALADFQGAVLLITHDPHLVELVADRLWLVADGTVRPFDGDLDDYRALVGGARPPGRQAPTPSPARTTGGNGPKRARRWRRCAKRRRTAEKRLARARRRTRAHRGAAGRSGGLCAGPDGGDHRRQCTPGRHREGSRGRRGSLADGGGRT